MQSSREEAVPTGPGERAPAGPTDSTQAPEPAATGGKLRAQPPSASEQRSPTAPAEVIESHPPAPPPPPSRIWDALVSFPRLFLRREVREDLSRSGNHVVEEERVRVAGMRGEGRAGETTENCVREQGRDV